MYHNIGMLMKKVVIVDSCRDCPYLGYYKRKKSYVCMITSKDITHCLNDKTIDVNCSLDNAVVDKKYFNNPSLIASEGTAICMSIPENDSFNQYFLGIQYRFQRQVDGNIKLFHQGIENQKYMLYPPTIFEKYFQISGEQSMNLQTKEVCPNCDRPVRFCE